MTFNIYRNEWHLAVTVILSTHTENPQKKRLTTSSQTQHSNANFIVFSLLFFSFSSLAEATTYYGRRQNNFITLLFCRHRCCHRWVKKPYISRWNVLLFSFICENLSFLIRLDRNACPMFNALRNRGSRIHKSIARITPQRKLIFYVFMIQTRMPMNQFISYQFIVWENKWISSSSSNWSNT